MAVVGKKAVNGSIVLADEDPAALPSFYAALLEGELQPGRLTLRLQRASAGSDPARPPRGRGPDARSGGKPAAAAHLAADHPNMRAPSHPQPTPCSGDKSYEGSVRPDREVLMIPLGRA